MNMQQQQSQNIGFSQYQGPGYAGQSAYPPAAGDQIGADNFQLPPNVTIDKLPMQDGDGTGMPSAPPMDTVQGYGDVPLNNAFLPPPSYDQVSRNEEPTNRPAFHPIPIISETEARSALVEHCNQHCCYGTGAAKEMVVGNMESSSAYHYILESFGEARSTAWTSVPYMGGPVDGPMNKQAPLPWSIQAYAAQKFTNEKRLMEIPHTSCVKQCHKCFGMGRLRCHHCFGRGSNNCSCHGGHTGVGKNRRTCTWCHGSGRRRCTWCHGHGHIRCSVCQGYRQVRWFIQLTITWTNHNEDYILERTAMPDEKIRDGAGDIVFEEEMPWVYPVTQCPEPVVNHASAELVAKHRTNFQTERILLQRHRIRVVPVTEVKSNWKNKQFTYYVFGLDHKVYAAEYPQQCCCGCSLL